MSHADDDGIVLPPRVASAHVVLMPIIRKPDDKSVVMNYVNTLKKELADQFYHQNRIRVEIDTRDIGGARNWDWIKKGIPLRVEIGPRDIEKHAVFIARRDQKTS